MEELAITNFLNEIALVKTLERIDDLASFRKIKNTEEAVGIANEILSIDILSLKYVARECLLHTLLTLQCYYNLSSANLNVLGKIKDQVEPDLADYIVDLLL